MDPVHQHEGVWYFWNETFDKRIGSYASKAGAEVGLEVYLQELKGDKSMAKTNLPRTKIYTHEGAKAQHINSEQQLRRSVMACLLWENSFYEDGIDIATRISQLVIDTNPQKVADIAIEAREIMNLRHVPLWITRVMAKLPSHKHLVASTLARIIQRPDELTEFLSLYWLKRRQPLSAQVKKGLAAAFGKFDEYQLAKYNRDTAIKLKDVLFLSHAKPKDDAQAKLWTRLIEDNLAVPDTWEVALSGGEDKKTAWERLLAEQKLGGMALLRNLRNMQKVDVNPDLIEKSLDNANFKRVLPFRFVAAAKYNPHIESAIERAMLKSLVEMPKLAGSTVLLIDSSGSMNDRLSGKSELNRWEAAVGLAILCREICENIKIFDFAGDVHAVPNRHGFGLKDAIRNPHNGTRIGMAVTKANSLKPDRIICLTDEQSHDQVSDPVNKGYMINVAAYKNGIGYGKWTHIDGFSQNIIRYIIESER